MTLEEIIREISLVGSKYEYNTPEDSLEKLKEEVQEAIEEYKKGNYLSMNKENNLEGFWIELVDVTIVALNLLRDSLCAESIEDLIKKKAAQNKIRNKRADK